MDWNTFYTIIQLVFLVIGFLYAFQDKYDKGAWCVCMFLLLEHNRSLFGL